MMRRYNLVLHPWFLIISLLFTLITPAATIGQAQGEQFAPDQVVIKLDPAIGATIEQINADYGTTTIRSLQNSSGVYLLQINPGDEVEGVVAELQDDGRLLFAEPNFIGQPPEDVGHGKWAWGGQDANPGNQQYARTMLNLPAAHTLSRGANVVVAVLDTGIQLNHPVLAPFLTAARYDFVDDDAVPDEDFSHLGHDHNVDGLLDETAGHGTHVAGIIHQIAPEAQIMPIRVLNADGFGNIFLIAEAIKFAAQNGADVINLSLGTHNNSALLSSVIAEVLESTDVVLVAAAGNDNNSELEFPAAEPGVIAVTAINANRQKEESANFGAWIDIAAPGDGIYSPFPINGYAYWSGTSMATPWIAGQAALLRSQDPSINYAEILEVIQLTAQPLGAGLGAGLANPWASLNVSCDDDDGCPPLPPPSTPPPPPGPGGQTVILAVTDGWDTKLKKLLSQDGKVYTVQTSDNNWWETEKGYFTSFKFQGNIPANAAIQNVILYIEHHQEPTISANSILWQVGTGNIKNPTVLSSRVPVIFTPEASEALVAWDVTAAINTPARLNDLKFVVRNNDTVGKKSKADRIYVLVNYAVAGQ